MFDSLPGLPPEIAAQIEKGNAELRQIEDDCAADEMVMLSEKYPASSAAKGVALSRYVRQKLMGKKMPHDGDGAPDIALVVDSLRNAALVMEKMNEHAVSCQEAVNREMGADD